MSQCSSVKGRSFVLEPLKTHLAVEDLPSIGPVLAGKLAEHGMRNSLAVVAKYATFVSKDPRGGPAKFVGWLNDRDVSFVNDTQEREFLTGIAEKWALLSEN